MSAAPFRVCCLDGGGIRGLITAVWLSDLQTRVGRPLRECFDLVAGTSTGAILACAVGAGLELDQVVRLYLDRGERVFPRHPARAWSRLARLFHQGPSAPKYDGAGLEAELRELLGDRLLGSLMPATLLTTYHTRSRRPLLLRSWADKAIPAWQAAKASAAAPTYFPAQMVELRGVLEPLIDGGVFANNPSLIALAEARALWGEEPRDVLLASFGTGSMTTPISASQAQEWGLAEWAPRIVDVFMDATADAVDIAVAPLVTRYYRFQMTLPHGYDAMDDARAERVRTLASLAWAHLQEQDVAESMRALAGQLAA